MLILGLVRKEYYLFKSKNKTSALKVLHKVHCAQEIQYKYKKMYLMRQQRETLQDSQHDIVQDPSMLRALNIFRNVIKQGQLMSAHAVPERSSPIKCVIVKCININKIQQLLHFA